LFCCFPFLLLVLLYFLILFPLFVYVVAQRCRSVLMCCVPYMTT
jgi:hypothetical protein